MKPPFAYYGGKVTLANRIVSLLPPHRHYVEPFAGSLAVFLAKPPSKLETLNDLDQDLMTFWRVLRDRGEDLARVAAMTPHSRAEHIACRDLDTEDELERARRVWVLLSQGRTGTLRTTGWRYYSDPAGTSTPMPGYLAGYVGRMPDAAWRLRQASLECRDALDVIRDYGRTAEVCIYADPPYVGSVRSVGYRHEMGGDAEHRALAEALRDCAAAVVLSGYHSPLYDDLYGDWHRAELSAWTGNGIRDNAAKTDGDRVEVLWSNRPIGDLDLFSSLEEVTA